MVQISAVIPLLDEAESLRELHERLAAVLKEAADDDFEIVFVNDGSSDDSAKVLEEIAARDPHVLVVELRRSFGKAAALAAGFRHAHGTVLAMLDADLQDVPEELPRLLERIHAGADIVTGRKRNRRDPWTRVAASWVFNRMISLLTGTTVRDVNSGFKLMRREVLHDLPLQGDLHRYLPVFARARGFAVEEVYVSHEPRLHGRSRYGWSRYASGILDTVTVVLLTRYDKRPLHFFGLFGFILSFMGIAILTYLSVGWLMGQWIGNRPLLPFGILMMILGLQSVFFGILAELVVLRDRGGDPGYSIRRVLGHSAAAETESAEPRT